MLGAGLFALTAAQLPEGLVSRAFAQGAKPSTNLIGKLEGAEVVLDPARFPKTFKEAPPLAELVKAGKLPPVQERIGQDPLVVKPLREIGKYGGTWRRGFTGPFDTSNGHRVAQNDKLLYWDYTGTKLVPNIARAWEVSPDGKVTTHLPAPRHEVERRPALHRRRLRVLVRGRLRQQGAGARRPCR